jgi:hypothetical protein
MSNETCTTSTEGEHNPNPIHEHTDGTWWFWDEVWCEEHGPYETKEACTVELDKYCKEVLGIK